VSVEAQRVYLSNKFTGGGIAAADFPVMMPNIQSNIPENAPYGEFYIVSGGKPVIMGGEGVGKVRVKYVGMVQLTVWIPEGKGTKPGTTIGDKFKGAFAGQVGRDAAQQVYRFGYMQDFTPQVKTGWECLVYRVPFTRETVEDIQVSN
jgi:hypothetical protein